MNPLLANGRLSKIQNKHFTIISNNCWGGHVYRYYNMEYTSPTIGLYFYSEDFVKFIYNLRQYIELELSFITLEQSRYKDDLVRHGNTNCPIGKLGDIEIIFLHYKTEEEAALKWNRRKRRIVWDNIVYKMSEQNLCSVELLEKFDQFPVERKLVFVTQDYGLKSQVLWGSECERGNIAIDTVEFRKYVNIEKFINGNPTFKKNQLIAARRINKLK